MWPFEVEIRAWDRDPEGLEPVVERHGLGIQEIRRTLNNYCGVSIYRDGFRVYPYGQRGNDWPYSRHKKPSESSEVSRKQSDCYSH